MKALLTALLLSASMLHAQYPWSGKSPQEIVQDSLHPNQVLDEKPCDWRRAMESICRPLVKDCRTAGEAALCIASALSKTTGVHYSRERRHPLMNPQESLLEKKVSCTGQSILLVCALRSVGIPARAVGICTWGHIRGNHTWCEAWCEGEWKMVEFNERNFNTPWVLEAIGMINPQFPTQRIYAAAPSSRDGFFPAVWNPWSHIAAEDVTERYLALSRTWYEQSGLPANCQRLLIDVSPRPHQKRQIFLETEQGECLAEATAPTSQDDMRYLARMNLPNIGFFYLRIEDCAMRYKVKASSAPAQIVTLPSTDSP